MTDQSAATHHLKGILKKPTESTPADPRELAIHHASILQNRKDLATTILKSLEMLSQFPTLTSYTAANPARADALAFKTHIRLFQPSDYEDLVEERNVNDLCGYTLCPNPKPNTKGGKWTLRKGQIIDRHETERWCSDECKKRALYVKIQLSETAAWERVGIPDIHIDLLGEDPISVDQTAQKLGELQLENQRQAAKDSAALALERGDQQGLTPKLNKSKLTIREKDVRPPDDSSAGFEDEDYLRVEGHVTGAKSKKRQY